MEPSSYEEMNVGGRTYTQAYVPLWSPTVMIGMNHHLHGLPGANLLATMEPAAYDGMNSSL